MGVSAAMTAFDALGALRGRTSEERAQAAPFFRIALAWALLAGAAAVVVSAVGLTPQLLLVGPVVGVSLAIASLFHAPARRAFDRLRDADVRAISAYRTLFGAFLFAGAGFGLFPPVFALVAGTGDLVAGWLAAIAPRSLAASGSRTWRLVVHGYGTADLVDVLVLVPLVVRPWLIQTGSAGPSLLLPWVAVPVLFATNLHGLRSALTQGNAKPRASDAAGALEDGFEPARGV
jgi:hypothetical protein